MSLLIVAVVFFRFSFTVGERLFHINTIIYRLPYWITVAHTILR
ncbi:MAG TPA: hypothetical protein VNM47_16235 [Terriglobia bacterium]|nr:hypothetical protein [Terriglobia bacterium]